MASYYIIENGQQSGPYTVDQLSSRGITPDTNVWTDGMTNWVPASQVYELQSIVQNPPAYSGDYQSYDSYSNGYSDYMPCPKTWMTESILVTLFCCLPFGIIGIINASKVSSAHAVGNYMLAQQASKDAGKWTKIGFVCGLIYVFLVIGFYLLYFFVIIAAAGSGY